MNIRRACALLIILAAASCRAELKPVLNREYLAACTGLIDSAEKTIDVSELYFKEDPAPLKIRAALARAVKRKVAVRVLLEDAIKENPKAAEEMNSLGMAASLDSPKRQNHNKFIVADGRAVLLGSTNLSEKSIMENNEANALVTDAGIAAYYAAYFEFLYGGCLGKPPRFEGKPPRALPLGPKRYFFAVNDIISAPHKRIGVVMYNMRSYKGRKPNPAQKLILALAAAARKGTDVRVVLEKSGHDEELNASNEETAALLRAAGVKVRFDAPETITHAKLMVADSVAVLGSTNWGMAGFAKNEECNIETWDPKAVAAYWEYFETLWNAARGG